MGQTGLQLSEFGLGSWVNWGTSIGLAEAKEILALAYDAGINFFDNAEGYEGGLSEQIMGDAINALGWSRDSYVVTSKVFWGGDKPTQRGLSRKHVFDACHAALNRLKVDYLDVFYCHRPDIDTPISETVEAMSDLVRQGKVMYWGTSEWSAQQITQAKAVAKQRNLVEPMVEQPEYNLLNRTKVEGEFRPLYSQGLGLTTYSPLASGLLTGKYLDGVPADSRLARSDYQWLREIHLGEGNNAKQSNIKRLNDIAGELNMSLSHLALVWILTNKCVSSVILGVNNTKQLSQNLGALDSREKLDAELLTTIDEILGNKPSEPERF
ncbi:aldo/keto reductase [Aliiglaciecola litoralis]|uniref:Aldo/keto reductase n=2 Tax=Aliiglaciecola litoralis TaxID=582857 RepID=A0ABP3WPS4_9ALTE